LLKKLKYLYLNNMDLILTKEQKLWIKELKEKNNCFVSIDKISPFKILYIYFQKFIKNNLKSINKQNQNKKTTEY